ncbi:MAG: hypothetical protein FRX48_00909 [Lasallia pustulata]|uniref:Uncharacterized protein n=1 Tax=Lasallia pustulata TaxID=136370 RepID=A0A5M8Q523_9LECA|nr:MAG: hypothetical protein FRX48_00909 [Lasallia pustulata]
MLKTIAPPHLISIQYLQLANTYHHRLAVCFFSLLVTPMAKHRRSRRRAHKRRGHEDTEAPTFHDRGSSSWDGRDHRRESRLGSSLVSDTRLEGQSRFGRLGQRNELQMPHGRREFNNNRPQQRSASMTSIFQPHRDLRYQRYDHIIRDLFIQGSVIEQKVKRLLDGLAHIQPSPEEMEWEMTNSVYYVPLALANVVDGRRTVAAASSPRQEGDGMEISSPGRRQTQGSATLTLGSVARGHSI